MKDQSDAQAKSTIDARFFFVTSCSAGPCIWWHDLSLGFGVVYAWANIPHVSSICALCPDD